jgi:hypothetical protein
MWDESPEGFRHEALVYSGDDEFVSTVGSFIDIGRSRAEPTFVVVAAPKIALLRELLGGDGVLRIWHESDRVICEIRDRGKFDNPLADRRLPHPRRLGGRGLWTANHVCDLVQIRTLEQWTVVRLHVSTDGPPRSNPNRPGTITPHA